MRTLAVALLAALAAVPAASAAPFEGGPSPEVVAESFQGTWQSPEGPYRIAWQSPERWAQRPTRAAGTTVVERGGLRWILGEGFAAVERRRFAVEPDGFTYTEGLSRHADRPRPGSRRQAHARLGVARRSGRVAYEPLPASEQVRGPARRPRDGVALPRDAPAAPRRRASRTRRHRGAVHVHRRRRAAPRGHLRPRPRAGRRRPGRLRVPAGHPRGGRRACLLRGAAADGAAARLQARGRRLGAALRASPAPRGREPGHAGALRRRLPARLRADRRQPAPCGRRAPWQNDPFGRECVFQFEEDASIGGVAARYAAGPGIVPHLYWRAGGLLYTVSGPVPEGRSGGDRRVARRSQLTGASQRSQDNWWSTWRVRRRPSPARPRPRTASQSGSRRIPSGMPFGGCRRRSASRT